jgi:hypothetical protein
MHRLLVRLFGLVFVLLVLVAAGVAAVVVRADALARVAIERAGASVLGVETRLGSARVRLLAGELDLAQLRVAEPPGFGPDPFLTMAEGHVRVSLASLFADTVVVPEVRLDHVGVTLERGSRGANYDAILAEAKKRRSAPAAPEKPGKKFVIKEIVIRDIAVHARGRMTPASMPLDYRIPEIRLHDVGSGAEHGVQLAEVQEIVVRAILKAATGTDLGTLPKDLGEGLKKSLSDLDRELEGAPGGAQKPGEKPEKGAGDEVKDAFQKAGEESKKILRDIGDALGIDGGSKKK